MKDTKKEKTDIKKKVKAVPKEKAVKKEKKPLKAVKKTAVKAAVSVEKPAKAVNPRRKVLHKENDIHKKGIVPVTEAEIKEEIQEPVAIPKEEKKTPHKKEVNHPAQQVVEEKKEIPLVKEEPVVKEQEQVKELELELPITVKDLAIKLQEKSSTVIKFLMESRVMAGLNQTLDEAVVESVCAKFGYKLKKALGQEEFLLHAHQIPDKAEDLIFRAPIVTLMGHVDHGKTSLLDMIRKSKVVDEEHGGITQHIGAYRVSLEHGEITFLDTPGHEAFTAMRSRGAKITDIVVLVVAADDGIMPQTVEAIDHARAAGVSIIVAINKIDKPQADIDRVKKQLSGMNLMSEDWGGKIITVPVSAKTGDGIDNLLEMILLEAQMLELRANPERLAKGVVIEAKVSKGRGPVATLLVQNGTLNLNENIIVGNYYGKIRAMFNDHGHSVTSAGPTIPVEILGLSGVPSAGEQFFVIADEKQAKEIAQHRQEKERLSQIKTAKKISLEELHAQIKEGKIKELKIIIKSDVQGSLEAIKQTLDKLNVSEIKLNIIHAGVGNINSSDVILAVASDALILGFNVVCDDLAKESIAKEGIEVKLYNIIYELANEIKAAIEGMLEPKLKRNFLGKVEVRKMFKLSTSGTVAGCYVSKGKITRSTPVSLVRNGEVIFEGSLSNLKRFKDDVREVTEGFECGLTLSGFDSLQEGDIIEAYTVEKIARKL
ncbi:MAG: translation initiation factor IF-2 [Candidatus Omnitrophota bacterium]